MNEILAAGASAEADAPGQYLTFQLDGDLFALDIRSVREIIQFQAITPIPHMARFVRGIINLRGTILPVIDLRARFGRERSQIGRRSSIIIFDSNREGEKHELGLLVDGVSAVVDLALADIESAPPFGSPIRRDFVLGVGKLGRTFVIILDPARALDLEDMALMCTQTAEAVTA